MGDTFERTSVLDVALAKVVLRQPGPGLCNPKVRANVVRRFLEVHGTDTAQRVRFHILVSHSSGFDSGV